MLFLLDVECQTATFTPAIGDVRENSTLNMATAHTLHLEILSVGYGYSILKFL